MPRSTIRPASMTRIMSASRMVDRRWAMTKLVRPRRSVFIARWIKQFGPGVHRAGRLVQDEDGRFGQESPGDGDELAFAGADARPLLVDHRVVALGQGPDEVVDVGGTAAALISSRVAPGAP